MSTGEDQADIPGKYPQMARQVRAILLWDKGSEKISTRDAWRMSGVSHTTISSMTLGDRPSMELLIEFGRNMGADVNALLRSADYPEIKTDETITRELIIEQVQAAARDGEIQSQEAEELIDILQRRRGKEK